MEKNRDITEVRLFISSTFQDMQEERNYLMRRVAPRLRELCASYGLNFFCYDLRWGITEEMQELYGTVRSCLTAVENTRPFFVGILGERYGWIPDVEDLTEECGENERGKSITELEILRGVAAEGGFCSFYLRDREASGGFVETDPARIAALDALKDFVRQTGYPCYEGYTDAKEFGEKLYEDFAAWLRRSFTCEDIEYNKQRAYVGELSRLPYGNLEIENDILARLKGESPVYILTEGKMLSGIVNTNPRFIASDDFDLIAVNLEASLSLRTAYDVMVYVLKEAKKRYPDRITLSEIPEYAICPSVEEKGAVEKAFRDFCSSSELPKRLLVAITSPELFEGIDGAFTWAPDFFGDSVRLLVLTCDDTYVSFLNAREWQTRKITFDKKSHMLFLNEFFARHGKRLSDRQIDLIYYKSAIADDFDVLMLFAEALVKGTVFDELDEKLDMLVSASERGVPGVAVIEDLFLTKLSWDEQNLYYKTYPFLVESGFSIREEELYEALRCTTGYPLAMWQKVQAMGSPVLQKINGSIVITNPAVRRHMQEYAYLLNSELERERVLTLLTGVYHIRYFHAVEEDPYHKNRYTVELCKKYLTYQLGSEERSYLDEFFEMRKMTCAVLMRNDPAFFRTLMLDTQEDVDWIAQFRENEDYLVYFFMQKFGNQEGKRLFLRLFRTMKFFDTDDELPEGRTEEQAIRYQYCSDEFLSVFFPLREEYYEIDSQASLDSWYERAGKAFANVTNPYELGAVYFLMADYANLYGGASFKLRMAKLLVHYAMETGNEFSLPVGIYYAAKAYFLMGDEGYAAAKSLFRLAKKVAYAVGDFYIYESASVFYDKMN